MVCPGLEGIDQGAEGGRSRRRARECEANHPEERSVKRMRDEMSSGETLE